MLYFVHRPLLTSSSSPFFLPREPPYDEHSYFLNYDETIAAKEETIIICKHHSRPYFADFAHFQDIIKNDTFHLSKIKNRGRITDPNCTVWVDIQYPRVSTLQYVASVFKLFRSTLHHLLGSNEDEQLSDTFQHYHFTSTSEYHIIPGTNIWQALPVHLLLPNSSSLIISFHYGPGVFVSHTLKTLHSKGSIVKALQQAEIESEQNKGEAAQDGELLASAPSPSFVLYVIIDGIVDRYIRLVDYCLSEANHIEEFVTLLSAGEHVDLLRRITDISRRIGNLRCQLFRKKDILTELLKVLNQQVYITLDGKTQLSSLQIFFRDILDHINGMLLKLNLSNNLVKSSVDAYLTRLSIQLNLQSQEQNKLMKFFSSVATIFLPISIIPSFFGMNVNIPGENSNGLWVFGVIVGSVLGGVVLAFLMFWRVRWI